MTQPATCRGCGAPITWAVTLAGKLIPLDAEPDPAGNMVLTGATGVSSSGRPVPEAHNVGPQGLLPDERVRYLPHHASCPDVEQFRR